MNIIADLEGLWTKVKTKEEELRATAESLIGKEASMFEVTLAAAVKTELPLITAPLYSKLKTLAAQACALAETEVKNVVSGDEKWTAAMGHFVSGIESLGLNSGLLSTFTKESMLQAGGQVMKMLGAAAFATANPTASSSASSPKA